MVTDERWNNPPTHHRPWLIGVGGALAAGKDTFADWLVDNRGFVKLGMSDPLLEAALKLDPIIHSDPLDPIEPVIRLGDVVTSLGYVEAKKLKEVRRFLQVLGTEVGREMIGENVWVDMAAKRIDDLRYAGLPVVITGIRFPNELEMIHRLGGKSVWVRRLTEQSTSAHASENSVTAIDFDVTVENGSLEGLYASAGSIVEDLVAA